jgi:serine phosphatase RsbU (regulator of sigma subunit)/putative methionine-R-sulfoxide reductase with GAF domain
MFKILTFIILFICLKSFNVLGLELKPIIWNKLDNKKMRIGNQISVLPDQSEKITINDVVKRIDDFEKSDKNVPYFGISKKNQWIHLKIKNNQNTDQFIYLEIARIIYDEIEFYEIKDKKVIKKYKNGDAYNFSNRNVDYRFFLYPLKFKKNETKSIILKVNCWEINQLVLNLYNKQYFVKKIKFEKFFYGLLFGALAFIGLYNIFVYFVFKDITYLYYVMAIFSAWIYSFHLCGYGYELLWPNSPDFQKNAYNLFHLTMSSFGLLFSSSFCDFKKTVPKFYKWVWPIFFAHYIFMIFSYLGFQSIIILLIGQITSALYFVQIYIIWKLFKQGFRPAKYFLVSNLLFMLSFTLPALAHSNLIEFRLWMFDLLSWSLLVQMILLGLGLGDRIILLREEKSKAQKEALKHQEEANLRMKEQVFYLTKINEANSIVCSINEMNKMCQHAVDELKKIITCDVISFYRYHQEDNKLFFNAYSGIDGLTFSDCINTSGGIFSSVVDDKKSYLSNDFIKDSKYIVFDEQKNNKYQAHKILSVPVLDDNNVLGVINFTKSSNSNDFTESQLNIAETLATSISISHQNIILLEETAEKALMEKELETTSIVQASFFPKNDYQCDNFEIASHFQSCDLCGGDWWGYEEIDDHVIMMIGDVSGHGTPSALITAVACSFYKTIYNMAEMDKEQRSHILNNPNDLLASLNKVIYQISEQKYFMTFQISILNKKTGVIKFSSAGHNFPLIFRDKTKEIEPLIVDGAPLGYTENWDGEFKEITLNPNDLILWFTDGLTEAKNPSGKMIRERSIYKLISKNQDLNVKKICQITADFLYDYIGSGKRDDDITFIFGKLK